MLVVCEYITPRVSYVLDYVLTERLGIDYRAVVPGEVMDSEDDNMLSYLKEKPENTPGIWIPYSGFLNEKGWRGFAPATASWNTVPVLFPGDPDETIPFDLFAAVFWFLSRYEEYDNTRADEHGRFPAKDSLAVKEGFHDQPVVDLWIASLRDLLQKNFHNVEPVSPPPFLRLTIDVDQAFAVKHKGLLRTGGALLRAMTGETEMSPLEYLTILGGRKKDPFDTFATILPEGIKKEQVIFFYQTGSWGRYDKNISIRKMVMDDQIKDVSKRALIGLHPSYGTFDNPQKLLKEKEQLEEILGTMVISSRYHYLRFRLPESYQNLVSYGFTEDYSMGWPVLTGFRAGTAHPFPWYDIHAECHVPLTIYPFLAMDGVLKDRLKLSAREATSWLEEKLDLLYSLAAPFIILWHNHSYSESAGWEGWSEVFDTIVKKAIKRFNA